jgi:hypothetical protein
MTHTRGTPHSQCQFFLLEMEGGWSYTGVQSINNVYANANKVQNPFIDALIFDLIDNGVYVVYALYSSIGALAIGHERCYYAENCAGTHWRYNRNPSLPTRADCNSLV